MTISARSTSSRSTSSRRINVSRRSNGPAKTSRSSSRSTRRTEWPGYPLARPGPTPMASRPSTIVSEVIFRPSGHLGARVGDGGTDLLGHHAGLVQDQHGALLAAAGGGHLALGELEVHDPGAYLRDSVLGDHQDLAEARIETLGDVAHQFDVLALVVAHRYLIGPVGEHVGGHEHGIEEECCSDEVA